MPIKLKKGQVGNVTQKNALVVCAGTEHLTTVDAMGSGFNVFKNHFGYKKGDETKPGHWSEALEKELPKGPAIQRYMTLASATNARGQVGGVATVPKLASNTAPTAQQEQEYRLAVEGAVKAAMGPPTKPLFIQPLGTGVYGWKADKAGQLFAEAIHKMDPTGKLDITIPAGDPKFRQSFSNKLGALGSPHVITEEAVTVQEAQKPSGGLDSNPSTTAEDELATKKKQQKQKEAKNAVAEEVSEEAILAKAKLRAFKKAMVEKYGKAFIITQKSADKTKGGSEKAPGKQQQQDKQEQDQEEVFEYKVSLPASDESSPPRELFEGNIKPDGSGEVNVKGQWTDEKANAFAEHLINDLNWRKVDLADTGPNAIPEAYRQKVIDRMRELAAEKGVDLKVTVGGKPITPTKTVKAEEAVTLTAPEETVITPEVTEPSPEETTAMQKAKDAYKATFEAELTKMIHEEMVLPYSLPKSSTATQQMVAKSHIQVFVERAQAKAKEVAQTAYNTSMESSGKTPKSFTEEQLTQVQSSVTQPELDTMAYKAMSNPKADESVRKVAQAVKSEEASLQTAKDTYKATFEAELAKLIKEEMVLPHNLRFEPPDVQRRIANSHIKMFVEQAHSKALEESQTAYNTSMETSGKTPAQLSGEKLTQVKSSVTQPDTDMMVYRTMANSDTHESVRVIADAVKPKIESTAVEQARDTYKATLQAELARLIKDEMVLPHNLSESSSATQKMIVKSHIQVFVERAQAKAMESATKVYNESISSSGATPPPLTEEITDQIKSSVSQVDVDTTAYLGMSGVKDETMNVVAREIKPQTPAFLDIKETVKGKAAELIAKHFETLKQAQELSGSKAPITIGVIELNAILGGDKLNEIVDAAVKEFAEQYKSETGMDLTGKQLSSVRESIAQDIETAMKEAVTDSEYVTQDVAENFSSSKLEYVSDAVKEKAQSMTIEQEQTHEATIVHK